jgi:hypothetical protein
MRHISLKSLAVTVLLAGGPTLIVVGQNSGNAFKAHDPGPRPNAQSPVPNPVPGLNENETALFNESLLRVSEVLAIHARSSRQMFLRLIPIRTTHYRHSRW